MFWSLGPWWRSLREKWESFIDKSCNVRGSLALVIQVARPLGLAPIRFMKYQNEWRITISTALCVYSYLATLLVDIVIIRGLVLDVMDPENRAELFRLRAGHAAFLASVGATMILNTAVVVAAPKVMAEWIDCLADADEILSKITNGIIISWPERREMIVTTVWILCASTVSVSDVYLFVRSVVEGDTVPEMKLSVISTIVLFYLQYTISVVFHTMLVLVDLYMHRMLKAITIRLTKIKVNEYKWTSRRLPGSICDTIRSLSCQYNEACAVIRRVNEVNGTLTVMLLLVIFIRSIISGYYFVDFIMNQKAKKLSVFLQFCWCCIHIGNLMQLVEPGYRIIEEVCSIKMLLGKLMTLTRSSDSSMADLLNFQQIISLNKVECSPMDTCVLTRPVVATILGSVLTYLVVIIQMNYSDAY